MTLTDEEFEKIRKADKDGIPLQAIVSKYKKWAVVQIVYVNDLGRQRVFAESEPFETKR